MPIRVVIADDHPVVLAGLEHLVEGAPDLDVVAACLDGAAALAAVREHNADVLVLDLRMPGNENHAVLRALAGAKSRTRVILLTAELTEAALATAVRLGVCGMVMKEEAPRRLLEGIRAVHAGRRWFEASVAERIDALSRQPVAGEALTGREADIVGLIAAGLRNREIAARLGIGEGTVKNHLNRIYDKLGVESRAELLLLAQRNGLV